MVLFDAPRSFEGSPGGGGAEPEPGPELSWPAMAVSDLVDLKPADELRCDLRCMMIISLAVSVGVSMLSELKDSEPEPEPEPEPGPEL